MYYLYIVEGINKLGIIITIAVPVFNTKNYLERCVNSIINQTYRDVEILLVDDGSTDGSAEKCDELAMRDERIRVIHTSNQGLGMARNKAIENATGEYIIFVDSDDWIDSEEVEICLRYANEYSLQMVCFGMLQQDSRGNIIKRVTCKKQECFIGQNQIRQKFIPGMVNSGSRNIGLWMSLCTTMISLDFINKVEWKCESERKVISEDVYSLLELYSSLESVMVIPYCFYHYCIRESSLTQIWRSDRFERIKDNYEHMQSKATELGLLNYCKQGIDEQFYDYTIAYLKQVSKRVKSRSEKDKLFSQVVNDSKVISVLAELNICEINWKKRILMYALKNKQIWISRMIVVLREA